jgi:dTMP kinase
VTKFIVFEGIDGAGTTTHGQLAQEALGEKAWWTCEPTNGYHGALARQILRGEASPDLSRSSLEKHLIELFAKDRLDHLFNKGGIIDRLSEGEVVLCDRYTMSSFAYNGSHELVYEYNQYMQIPNLTIYLDVPVGVALKRIRQRGGAADIYEQEEKLIEVKKQYEFLIESHYLLLGDVVRVDGDRPVEEVHSDIMQIINNLLEN